MVTSSFGRLRLDRADFGSIARANAHIVSIDADFNAKLWDASLRPITGMQWHDLGFGMLTSASRYVRRLNRLGVVFISGFQCDG
jgi:hypothetical protein